MAQKSGRRSKTPLAVDRPRIERAVLEILKAIGEDHAREGLRGTPRRVAEMYEEIFAGMRRRPEDDLIVFQDETHEEMVLVRDIPFYSICEHHLMPFSGKAHIAYIPNKNRITGLSKLPRILDTFARRPQLQERLTTQVADSMMRLLRPQGVLIVVEAEHLCLTMRGVRKPGSLMVTSAVRGVFERSGRTRSEALAFLHLQR